MMSIDDLLNTLCELYKYDRVGDVEYILRTQGISKQEAWSLLTSMPAENAVVKHKTLEATQILLEASMQDF